MEISRPPALGANLLASLEGAVGVLGFAVATGLLYGRVSWPSARIGFSDKALVAPYQQSTSLQGSRIPPVLLRAKARARRTSVSAANLDYRPPDRPDQPPSG